MGGAAARGVPARSSAGSRGRDAHSATRWYHRWLAPGKAHGRRLGAMAALALEAKLQSLRVGGHEGPFESPQIIVLA
jgi:hypothetical protein